MWALRAVPIFLVMYPDKRGTDLRVPLVGYKRQDTVFKPTPVAMVTTHRAFFIPKNHRSLGVFLLERAFTALLVPRNSLPSACR